jgi:tetratricopeptide (TPR) repeat protein
MRKYLLIILLLIASVAHADDNAALLEKGNNAYKGKFYQQAIDCYLKVVKAGFEAPQLYYNLGNAYYKLNDYPSAILYFEKAKRLRPGDEDIIFNLKVANTKITDKIDAIPEFFLVRWYKGLLNIFSFNTWAILGIILLVVFLGIFTLYLFSTTLKIRKLAFWFSALPFILTILFFIFAQTQFSSLNNTTEAIIFSPSVTAKSTPDANSTDLFVIHEGTKVKVTDNVGEWSEIKIENGSKGWVSTSTFKVI